MDLVRRNFAIEPYWTIAAADLTCPQANLPQGAGAPLLLRNAVIEYIAESYDRISGSRLFWGPYINLDTGVYLFEFEGKFDGELTVDFAHQSGSNVLRQESLVNFDRPVCLVVTRPIDDLEVRAVKTEALRSLSLEVILVHRVYIAPKGDAIES